MNLKPLCCLVVSVFTALTPISAAYSQSYNLPDLGAAGGSTLSPLEERQIGEHIMGEVRSDPTYLPDPETTEYLNKIGYRLVSAGPANGYSYYFFAVRQLSQRANWLLSWVMKLHTFSSVI